MLDKRVFLREMAVLAELYNRPALSEVLIARYYEFLSTRLSTAEFEAAARRVFEEERFWPAPVTFVHLVKGDPKRIAGEAWTRLLSAAQSGRPQDAEPDAIAALRRAGFTFRDVETASEYRLGEIARAFASEHSAVPLPALPSEPS